MRKIRERYSKLKENKIKKRIYFTLCIIVLFMMTVLPLFLWLTSGIMYVGVTSIRGNSMEPTFSDAQILYVQPATYERGEIVVVNCDDTGEYHVNGIDLLKRIVGLPGETVEITEDGILINGKLLDESAYIDSWNQSLQENNDINELILSDNEYFILGDNRVDSFDSRHIGAVHSKDFLYGLTEEPNDYTKKILTNVSLVAIFNLIVIITMPYVLLIVFTFNRKGPTKKKKKNRRK